jgi:hypothetical protein
VNEARKYRSLLRSVHIKDASARIVGEARSKELKC